MAKQAKKTKNLVQISKEEGVNYSEMFDNPFDYQLFFVEGKLFLNDKQKKFFAKQYTNSLSQFFNFDIDDVDKSKEWIISLFENKRQHHLQIEEALCKELTKKNLSNKKLLGQNGIKFWTSFFNSLDNNGDLPLKMEDEQWLFYVVSTKEFSKLFAGKQKQAQQKFSRRKFTNSESEEAAEKVFQQYKNQNPEKTLQNFVDKSGILTDLTRALAEAFGVNNKDIEDIIKDSDKLKQKISKKGTFQNTKDYLKDWSLDVIEKIKKDNKINSNITKIQISKIDANNQKGNVYWTINLEEDEPGLLNLKAGGDLVDNFYNAMELTIKKIFNNKNKSVVLNFGVKQIQLPYKGTRQINAIVKNDKNKHKSALKKICLYNNVSTIIGALGEYKTQIASKVNIQLIGNEQEQKQTKVGNNTINLGSSFADAYFQLNDKETNMKLGINIKHYISKFGDKKITIYNSQKGMSFMANAMYKYFSEDEIRFLRFIDLNFEFFSKYLSSYSDKGVSKDSLLNLYKMTSIMHLSEFVRIESQGEISNNLELEKNYFFNINNAYVPVSYIYDIIIRELNNNFDNLFDITVNTKKYPIKESKDVASEEGSAQIKQEQAINNMPYNIKASRIKFKGLEIDNLTL